ncbi:MAG: hypothetical protein IJV67_05050 [Clostridia bacterium]|nr:hypothetical protein [Clostridia bacterium]
MKKLSLEVFILLALTLLFSFTACKEIENGVEIKYAKITFQIGEDESNTKQLTFKLYNYVHGDLSSVEAVEALGEAHYNGSVVNTIESSWLTFGGFKLNGEEFVANKAASITGQFYANGYSGNTRSVTTGSLLLYRDFNNKFNNDTAYDTADGTLVICTSAASPFSSNDYCVLGNVISEDLETLEEIAELRNSSDDEDETLLNYYYAGGLAEMFGENDQNLKDADFESEEIADIKEFEQKFTKATTLKLEAANNSTDIDEYTEFKTLATKLLSYVGGNVAEYFYTLPKVTVKVVGFSVVNKI